MKNSYDLQQIASDRARQMAEEARTQRLVHETRRSRRKPNRAGKPSVA